MLAAMALLAACTSGGSTGPDASSDATATPFIRSVIMGESTPEPLPDLIGDCEIRPGTQCPGADLRGADLGAIKIGAIPAGLAPTCPVLTSGAPT